ncbi:MAG TPA: hypothetical protein VFE47_09060 [Tepidisphaeraceae bacterium]|nr:hypothetical protein [Tepidisphaeraceae bacterium]
MAKRSLQDPAEMLGQTYIRPAQFIKIDRKNPENIVENSTFHAAAT